MPYKGCVRSAFCFLDLYRANVVKSLIYTPYTIHIPNIPVHRNRYQNQSPPEPFNVGTVPSNIPSNWNGNAPVNTWNWNGKLRCGDSSKLEQNRNIPVLPTSLANSGCHCCFLSRYRCWVSSTGNNLQGLFLFRLVVPLSSESILAETLCSISLLFLHCCRFNYIVVLFLVSPERWLGNWFPWISNLRESNFPRKSWNWDMVRNLISQEWPENEFS